MEKDPFLNFISDLSEKIRISIEHKQIMERVSSSKARVDESRASLDNLILTTKERIESTVTNKESVPVLVTTQITPSTSSIEVVSEENNFQDFVDKLRAILAKPREILEDKTTTSLSSVSPVKRERQEDTKKYVSSLNKLNTKETTYTQNYIEELDNIKSSITIEQEDKKIAEIKKLIEEFAQKYIKKAVGTLGESGGGTNAVQYANGGTMNGDLNVNGNYLSGGVNLLDIFALQPDLDNQTLSFNDANYDLSISYGNTVNLSAINTTFKASSGKYESSYTTTNSNSANWSSVYTSVNNLSASWEESAEIIPTVTNYLSTNNIVLSSATITNYLSTDTIYSSGTVGVISDNINEAGNGENTLTLAFQNGIFIENNLTSFGVISTGGGTSNNWNSNYTTVSQNSAYWADTRKNVTFEKDVTIQGNLTALGTSTFQNTIFTTTSALSVVNLGPGPALYVYQASGPHDVASFYDGDGVEVLHVGNAQGGGNPLGQVGINTSDPSAELTVNGAISSNGIITVLGGNSNQWNSNYTTTNTNSAIWSNWSTVSASYALGSQYVKLSGDTMTGALSTTVLSAGDIFVQGRTRITSRNVTNIFIGDNTTGSVNAAGNHNFVFGNNAGILLAAGSHNNFLGRAAGRDNTSGNDNNFFGRYAGRYNTTGGNNNFLGRAAGFNNTSGNDNNFFGTCAGHQIGKYGGSHNIFIGYKAGKGSYDSGYSPVGTGCSVSRNVAIGFKAGYSLRACGRDGECFRYGYAATDNIFIGHEAGFNAREGARHNNFFGNCAGRYNTSGSYNNFFGNCAGHSNTIGSRNNFLGNNAGRYNTYGSANNFLGNNAGRYNTTGSYNNFLGRYTGFSNTTGNDNNFLGTFTGFSNTTGCHNNFLGRSAGGCNTTGCHNNFLGNCAGRCNTSGSYNNFLGRSAGGCNTTGNDNNFFGNCAGRYNTSGSYNNFFGNCAGHSNTIGSRNNFLGNNAGRYNTTGSYNNFLGHCAGCTNTIGSNNIIVGNAANVATNSLSGVIVLGTGAIATQSHTLVIGSGTPPLSGLIRGNLHLTHSLSASNIALGGASVIVPTSTTDNSQHVIININGTNKAIRLWDYTE